MPNLSAMKTEYHYELLKIKSVEECLSACYTNGCKFYYVSLYTNNCYLYDQNIPKKCSISDTDVAIDYLLPDSCANVSGWVHFKLLN